MFIMDQPPQQPASAPLVAAVEVVAPRLPPSPGQAAYAVTALDGDVIAQSDRLDQALTSVPGVTLFRRTSSQGANPTTQGIALRAIAGSGAGRALVTLDGVPQNDPFGGWVIWSALPAGGIGHADIVRGAGSGPYGSGALTGVIALQEAALSPGHGMMQSSLSDRSDNAVYGAGAMSLGMGSLGVSAAYERSDGWKPVQTGSGAADQPLTLEAASTALRYVADIGPVAAAARVAVYSERRGSGLLGAMSRATGGQASLTLARQPTVSDLGWRLQGWVSASNLYNTSVATPAGRATTTPANRQYDTPALGYGLNAALLRTAANATLEVGADLRGSSGYSREDFRFQVNRFTRNRIAGGDALTTGVYADGSLTSGPWLATGGIRVDYWESSNAHRTEHDRATGATTLDLHAADRSGVMPTARAGLKRELGYGLAVRSTAYAAFRAPTLNELHRPFRVGNDVTEANPELKPERLTGAELGLEGKTRGAVWTASLFTNRLADAISNVTVASGPLTDSVAGFIPAGGVLRQRRNVDAINANGIEADVSRELVAGISLQAQAVLTRARVEGGSGARQLTGLRPAGTPDSSARIGLDWRVSQRLKLNADVQYESKRFDDDQNLRPLRSSVSSSLRAGWALDGGGELFIAADNIGQRVQTARDANGLLSYGPSRTVRVGLTLRR